MDTRHSANKSANVTGVNGVLLGVFPQETRRFTYWKRDVGSIPKTHCDSPKRNSRVWTGDIGVISTATTANDFAVIAEKIYML